jgi:type II secretory pathway pseudopilin PulG
VSGKSKKEYGGFLVFELIMALIAFAILMGGLALSLRGFAKFNQYQLARQRCIAAAQAQLDSLSVTGEPINDEDFERLWPELTVSIHEWEGVGQWKGMKRVRVITRGKNYPREVKVKMSRYMSGQRSH